MDAISNNVPGGGAGREPFSSRFDRGFSGSMQEASRFASHETTPSHGVQVPLTSARHEAGADRPYGQELSSQYRATDTGTRDLLGRTEKLNILASTTEPPPDRMGGEAGRADQMFRMQARDLVEAGIIGSESLIISSTGHDIPVMAALFERLDMSGVLHLPDFSDSPGNHRRVTSQAGAYGDDIQRFETRNAADGSVDSYFVGVDGHRPRGSFDTSLLPTAEQLEAAGVNRIVFLGEAAVGPMEFQQTAEFEPYLRSLDAAGIEVIMRGIDPRQRHP